MKRILLVLALLAVVSLGFSVSGALYMRYDANGSVHSTEWGMLDDLRVGRRGTGFDLNFDSFTLSYKLRANSSVGAGVSGALGGADMIPGTNTTLEASTPGYIQFTGLKVGNIDLGIGGSWWTYGESGKDFGTNLTSGTNADVTGSASWNYFAFDFQMSMPLGDSMRLHIDPWDKVNLGFGFGSADVKGRGLTNAGSSSKMDLILPIHLDYNADLLGLEIFPKITMNSTSDQWTAINDTNNVVYSDTKIGAMVRLSYTLNEFANIYAHVGFVSESYSKVTVSGATANSTNDTKQAVLDLPIFAGVCLKPAGPVNLNIGIGYLMKLSDTTTEITGSTTNVTVKGGGLVSEYGFYDEHGYKNPLLRFAGSAKFATDWEFGMSTIVYYAAQPGAGTGGGGGGYYTDTTLTKNGGVEYSKTTTSQLLHFNYFNNWDGGGNGFGANYIQYSKDNVTFRGCLSGGTGLAGLFGFVDASFAF